MSESITRGVFGRLADALEAEGKPPAGEFWTESEKAEFRDFRAGGPLPVSPGGVEILGISTLLDHVV